MTQTNIEVIIESVSDMEHALVVAIDAILVEEGMKAVVRWAKAFPKRHLRFVSGMGTATFACPSLDGSCFLLDLDDYCEDNRQKSYWSDRVAVMIQPIIDYYNLFWSFDLYKYPQIPDIIYNPITRTVECGEQIIHLEMR